MSEVHTNTMARWHQQYSSKGNPTIPLNSKVETDMAVIGDSASIDKPHQTCKKWQSCMKAYRYKRRVWQLWMRFKKHASCFSTGRGESFQTKQHQLVSMANVDLDLQLWAMVGNKKQFISLCILILGKRSPSSSNIDVFIQPLLMELQKLWHGVHALNFLPTTRES